MNVILSIDKYTNNNMKVKWSNYELAKSYDEYISSKNKVRRHIKKIGNFYSCIFFQIFLKYKKFPII